jgi:ketosteroid isomerase-like protein
MSSRTEQIEAYYASCNAGDAGRLAAHFTPDAAHYFTRMPPDRGREAIAAHWARAVAELNASWAVDHAIEQGDEACIEWTMTWTDPATGEQRRERGTEWYRFEDELIAEIRAYHHSDPRNRGGDLVGYER